MQDETSHNIEEDLDNQMENDHEEEDISHIANPNSIILKAIKNMKDELSIHNITKKDINEKIKKLSTIPLDKLSNLLLKFVKQASLSINTRKILFAAITPIHHIYMRLLTSYRSKDPSLIISDFSNSVSASSPPPFDSYSLKKSVEYFIKVYDILELGNPILNDNSFHDQIKIIIQKMTEDNGDKNNTILLDNIQKIEENLSIFITQFDIFHSLPKKGHFTSEKLRNGKNELKKFKFAVLPFFSLDESTTSNEYQKQFLKSYDIFYEQFRNFKLLHKINSLISTFKDNLNEPLAWFLPCLMTEIKSDTIFETAMEYLKTFWLICDMNIFNESTKDTNEDNRKEKETVQSDDATTNEKPTGTTNSTYNNEIDETVERIRREIFDILDLFSFTNKLQPQKSRFYAQGYQMIVTQYNRFYASNAYQLKGSYDTDSVRVIAGIISGLHFNLDDVTIELNRFLTERIKLLTQNSPILLTSCQNDGKKEVPSYIFPNGSQISPARINHDLCNTKFNELFTYVYYFIVFARKTKDTPAYSLIQTEIDKLLYFYSELLLKVQMTEDSDALVYEALARAKEADRKHHSRNELIETIDGILIGFESLIQCTERLLKSNFVKEDKRDLLERFLIYLKVHLPYYRIQKNELISIENVKQTLSYSFYLFDPLDLFCVKKLDVQLPEFATMSIDLVASSEHLNSDIDSNVEFTKENIDILFNQSFHSIRSKTLKDNLDSNDDWRSVLEFKSLYETFCRLYITQKPPKPFNNNLTEFEHDLLNFFRVSGHFISEFDLRQSMTSYPVKTVLTHAHDLSILLMFEHDPINETEIIHRFLTPWKYVQLTFQIPFLKIPHPIQTIWLFISIIMNKKKYVESNKQTIKSFLDIFTNFVTNVNFESITQLCTDKNVIEILSTFEQEQEFYFYLDDSAPRQSVEDGTSTFSKPVHYSIKEVLSEFQSIKEQYFELSQIVTDIYTKHFSSPPTYASLYIEIIFYANNLKSFRDTLVLIKQYDLVTAPPSKSQTLQTYFTFFDDNWPIRPDLLNLDFYEKELPDVLSSLYKFMLSLFSLTPDYPNICKTFNFHMNLALSTYSFCFSTVNSQLNQQNEQKVFDFKWNRDNFNQQQLSSMNEVKSENCLHLIRKHFDKIALIYSTAHSTNPSTSQCSEIIKHSTKLIGLLDRESLSGFDALSKILTNLCEVCFSIIFALNIKHQVQRITDSTVKFISLFGVSITGNNQVEEEEEEKEEINIMNPPKQIRTQSRRNSSTKQNIQNDCLELTDFPKLVQAFEHATPIFESTSELISTDIPETSSFIHARSLYNSVYSSMQELDVPATSERFVSIIKQTNKRMEQLTNLANAELHRIETKIERSQSYFNRMKSSLESDYNCLSQKIENETTKSEQLDESLSNIQSKQSIRKGQIPRPNNQSKSQKKLDDENELNFNFNTQIGKFNAKTRLFMTKADELRRQNEIIRSQIRRNQLELSILNCIDNQEPNEKDESTNQITEGKNDSNSNDHQDILSNESILSIVTAIQKGTEQTSNVTNISHIDLCDKVEMLAYNLISSTHKEENEMIQLQTKLKSMRNSQHNTLIELNDFLDTFPDE